MRKRSSRKSEEATMPATPNQERPSDAEPAPEVQPDSGKNPAAVALGRLGGLKGGKARATKLSKEQRREIARNAALARWARADGDSTSSTSE
jgi:hypothetical protein